MNRKLFFIPLFLLFLSNCSSDLNGVNHTSFSPLYRTMAINFAKARGIKYAHLGNDKINYPTCIYSTKPEIRDFTKQEKERLRVFVQEVLNEYVSYLYNRYEFNVRHVTLVDIMKSGPCRDTFYGKIDKLRLKPFKITMNPEMKNQGSAAFMNMNLHQYVATAPDFMKNWSPGTGLGYYESTSAVVRHELGHCWGLHHEINLPSAVYGVNHSQAQLKIFGDDIHGITHMWRKATQPDYTQDCPDGYRRVPNDGRGPKFPDVWGCMPEIFSMPMVKIKNKASNKCLYYPVDSEGFAIKEGICSGDMNRGWGIWEYDQYGRHVICSSPDLCIRSRNLSKLEFSNMELNKISSEYSVWYMIPNEDGSWMLQQPETVKVMFSSDGMVKHRNPKGNAAERWFVEDYFQ